MSLTCFHIYMSLPSNIQKIVFCFKSERELFFMGNTFNFNDLFFLKVMTTWKIYIYILVASYIHTFSLLREYVSFLDGDFLPQLPSNLNSRKSTYNLISVGKPSGYCKNRLSLGISKFFYETWN